MASWHFKVLEGFACVVAEENVEASLCQIEEFLLEENVEGCLGEPENFKAVFQLSRL